MQLFKQNTLLFIAAISIWGCENVVDIEVPEKPPKLVLNAYIATDSLWHVRLSHSKYVLDDRDYKEITDAEVSVFENGDLKENLVYQITDNPYAGNQGYYMSNVHKPQPGNLYRIEAKKNGYETIWAETRIPERVSIEKFTIDTSRIITRDYDSGYKLSVTFNDPKAIRNYYQVELLMETRNSGVITIWDENGVPRDSIYYYNSLSSVYITPLDPAINDEQFGYSNAVIFSDGRFNGGLYQFEFLVSEWYFSRFLGQYQNPNEEASLLIILRNIDEAMYLYETTADLQDWNSDNPFAEPVPVYSNVKNGYGVLGAYASDSNRLILKQ